MNIAFVLSYLGDEFGGPVTVIKNLGPMLAARGHSVSYWATANGRTGADMGPCAHARLYGTQWPHMWCRSPAMMRGLEEGVSKLDLLHINELWLYPIYAASKIARTHHRPYILRPAGSLEPWRLRRGWLRYLKKLTYLRLIGRLALGAASCLHAVSDREADHFRQVGYDGPVTIIPNGVDVKHFSPSVYCGSEGLRPDMKDRRVVLFMSRLSPEKGLDLLIPAWARLMRSASYRDAVLVIAGPDDRGYQRAVEKMIDEHDLHSRVYMAGMVRGQEKVSLLRRADVFVLPSYSENFGIVVAEAMACGTPVITTTGTPWEQLQQVDAGRWVPPTEDAIGEALRELLNMSESQRRDMGSRGVALVREQYTWDLAARKLLTVCDCILHGKAIPLYPEPKEQEKA